MAGDGVAVALQHRNFGGTTFGGARATAVHIARPVSAMAPIVPLSMPDQGVLEFC